jgi:hypothetical protein
LFTRDLEKPKALEAGAARTTVKMIHSQDDLDAAISQVVKRQPAEIGLNVELDGLDEGVAPLDRCAVGV